jgi:GNAT superfamily N-acetyltransferase
MARHALVVRDAGPDDVDALVAIWAEAGRGLETPRPHGEAATALTQLAANPDDRLLVGEYSGQVVAVMHMRRAPISPIHVETVVHTSFLLVLAEYRKHGFARALLEAAVLWAEEADIAHITATTSSTSRDTNRFLARLGLAQVAMIRFAPTAALRNRLTPERPGARALGAVLAQRRSMRRRQITGS